LEIQKGAYILSFSKSVIILFSVFSFSFADTATIAVLDFEANGVSEGEAQTISAKYQVELLKSGKFNVIERREMSNILKEQGFQQTGCVSTECAVQIGMLLGAKYMVAGSLGHVGKLYSLTTRLIEVKTGKIINFAESNSSGAIEEIFLRAVNKNLSQLFPNIKFSYIEIENTIPFATGHVKVSYGGVYLRISPTSKSKGDKEIKPNSIFNLIGETEYDWLVEVNEQKYYLTKSWSKKID
jgi:TolB-like protein